MGNRDDLGPLEKLTLWDLSFGDEPFQTDVEHYLTFYNSMDGDIKYGGGSLSALIDNHRNALDANPNMLLLVEITYFDGRNFNLSLDSPYWLRHTDGTIAHRGDSDKHGNVVSEPLLDFSHPEVQEMIIAQAVAIARCGLYDGIWLDRWTPGSDFEGELSDLMSDDAELEARDRILHGIRESVPDDFLIIVNSTWRKIPRWSSHINGVFIETWPEGASYTHQDYRNYEESLTWYETNLREPNLTLLRGETITYNDPQSDINQQVMRAFTALSLTHSEGYVTMSSRRPQYTYWYDFWKSELGHPISGRSQSYNNIEGVFIREFTKGWVVYNRSGKERKIYLPEKSSGAASGVKNKRWHTIPDLDGEIYLKSGIPIPADVNGDGIVNVLDMVIVANAFGTESPDINRDGVVNILDLVIVGNSFKEK